MICNFMIFLEYVGSRAYDSFSACKDSSFSGIPYAYILK